MERKLIIIFLILILLISGVSYSWGIRRGRSLIEAPVEVPEEIFMRVGEVTKIEGDLIYLNSAILGAEVNPLSGEIETEILKVKIGNNAEINKPEDPELGEQTEANFTDIKVGSLLYVFSQENIRYKEEFTAREIIILQ